MCVYEYHTCNIRNNNVVKQTRLTNYNNVLCFSLTITFFPLAKFANDFLAVLPDRVRGKPCTGAH